MSRSQSLIVLSALVVGAAGFTLVSGARTRVQTAVGELDHGSLAPIQLTGEAITAPLAFAIPTEIALVGSHIVVVDISSDSALHTINRHTGESVASFGRRGSGPRELQGAWSIDPDQHNQTGFWVYDLALKRSLHADLAVAQAPVLNDTYVSFLNAGATLMGPVRDAKGQWVSLGLFEEGRLGTFTSTGLPKSMQGRVPGPTEAPILTRQSVFHSTLVARPGRHQFAAVTRYASQLEIFWSDGDDVQVVAGPLFVDPDAPTRSKTRFGYIDGSATRDNIFTLFSGRTREAFKDRANFAQFVHVFDWEGTLVNVFQLDHDALAIAVGDDGATLYTLVHDPYPAIVRYPLGNSKYNTTLASTAMAPQGPAR